MEKIRKNDEVIVLTGKDKGKRGLVQQRVDALHVVVEGVNVAKKAVKPNPMTGAVGGIVDKTMPINVSNVALFNAATVQVVELALGHRVVHVDGAEHQLALGAHLVQAVHAGVLDFEIL